MSDPQNFGSEKFGPEKYGLDQLGQRLHAMGQPEPPPPAEPRLRPYQGAPLPIGQSAAKPASGAGVTPISGVRAFSPYEPFEPFEEIHQSTVASESTTYSNGWPIHPIADPAPEEASTTTPKALPIPAEDPNVAKSGLQRALEAVRTTIPVVQRLLPLLEGNFANVLAALVTPQPVHHPPPPPVNLEPIERGLADIRTGQRELRGQVQEQVVSLKRVEDQLERVREATDRNTLEQQELVEDLRSVGNRISTFAIVGLVLLAISLGLNIYFLIQLQHILR